MGQIILIGDYSQDNIDGIRNISVAVDNGLYSTFQFPQGTYYQVPNNAKLYICQIKIQTSIASTTIIIGYGDNSVIDSAVPPTNAIELMPAIEIDKSSPILEYTFFTEVQYNKYPYLYSNGSRSLAIIEGVEL